MTMQRGQIAILMTVLSFAFIASVLVGIVP